MLCYGYTCIQMHHLYHSLVSLPFFHSSMSTKTTKHTIKHTVYWLLQHGLQGIGKFLGNHSRPPGIGMFAIKGQHPHA